MADTTPPGLVVHVPHASTWLPDIWAEQFGISRDRLDAEIDQSADLFTDRLARQVWPEAAIVEAQVSRVLLDVERYDDDAREEMSRVGRGVIYTHDRFGQPLQRVLTAEDRVELLAKFYHPHWQRLRRAASGAVLIDLHSYPIEPWPIEPQLATARPEIDLGTSPGLTPPGWTAALHDHFSRLGFSVGENTPYSGVIDASADAAVMVEIRRDMLGSGPGSVEWLRLQNALSGCPLPDKLCK